MNGPELLIFWMRLWVGFCVGAYFAERLIANVLYLIANDAFRVPRWLRRLAHKFTRDNIIK